MKRVLVVTAMLGPLSCASSPQWTKPNATQPELQRDAFECEREAEDHHAYSATNPFGAAARADFFDRCMQTRGWTRAK